MTPLHPDDGLRLAADHARALHASWPCETRLRPALATRLRRLAAWLDPPGRTARPQAGILHPR